MTLETLIANLRLHVQKIDGEITHTDGNDRLDRPPTGDDYNRLWEAVWDELAAAEGDKDALARVAIVQAHL